MLVSALSGTAVKARIRKRSETTGYGDWWDEPGSQFTASRPAGVLLDQDGDDATLWHKVFSTLGTYSGSVEVFFYRDEGDPAVETMVGTTSVIVVDGVPQSEVIANSNATPVSGLSFATVGKDRTWKLGGRSAGEVSSNVLSVAEGSNESIAFDFSDMLDGNDSIESAVIVDTEAALTPTPLVSGNRRQIHVKFTGYTAETEYRIKATANTAQGESIVGYGVLVVN